MLSICSKAKWPKRGASEKTLKLPGRRRSRWFFFLRPKKNRQWLEIFDPRNTKNNGYILWMEEEILHQLIDGEKT